MLHLRPLQSPRLLEWHDEHVRLHADVATPRNVCPGAERVPHRLMLQVLAEGSLQPEDQHLVPREGRRGHEQLPVHHLVAVAVIRQRANHVDAVVDGGDHAHSIGSSAKARQEGGTPEGARATQGTHHPTHAIRTEIRLRSTCRTPVPQLYELSALHPESRDASHDPFSRSPRPIPSGSSRRLHHPRHPAGGGSGAGRRPQARQRQEGPPLEALRRGDQGCTRADRDVHGVSQARDSLPRAQAGAVRPRLSDGYGAVAGDRRVGHRRRQRRPLRPDPVPQERRPRRAVGRQPLRHGDAEHPHGAHRRLLVRPVGGPVVPDRERARHDDDRVGYFVSAMKNFSRDTAETFFVRYVNRWRLEKKDPSAAVSDPVKPIVYYLDRTIPLEWRPYVRDGILEWNRAFEEGGIRNAIQVLDAPDDTLWSAEDARYSTVRWMANNAFTYAIGPSDVDPRTGEILNADILIAASWIQAWQGEYRDYAGPQAMIREVFLEDSLLRADPSGRRFQRLCSYGASMAHSGTLLRATLAASGAIAPGGPVPREYIGQALKELVMHEVGHTLGLRHDFRGTAAIPMDKLFDRAYTATHGTSASVMDYNPPAIALDRSKQGDYYSRTIGTYDRWAIKYGYAAVAGATPDAERAGLRDIAAQASDPDHAYGTDEDAGFAAYGLDPTVTRYDQTSDPLAWAKDRATLVNRLFDSLETRLVAAGDGYPKLRRGFRDLLFERWYATLVTTKYLAGAYTSRDHRGDPNNRPPFVAVSAARQRDALAFIADAGLGENLYRFRPELLNKLAPERWWHWGMNPFSEGRIDFPLHDWALAFQGTLVRLLTDPQVLSRVRDAELRAESRNQMVTIPDILTTLTASVWAEAGVQGSQRAHNTTSIRRDLQRLYLARLLQIVVTPEPGMPEDARTVARADRKSVV